MTVPPIAVAPAGNVDTISAAPLKPNWIQDAEAIAKADINRLERKLKSSCRTLWAAYGFAVVAFILSAAAFGRTCR